MPIHDWTADATLSIRIGDGRHASSRLAAGPDRVDLVTHPASSAVPQNLPGSAHCGQNMLVAGILWL
jgi:hypothetical protein